MRKMKKFLIIPVVAVGLCISSMSNAFALTEVEYGETSISAVLPYEDANKLLTDVHGTTVATYKDEATLVSAIDIADYIVNYQELTGAKANELLTAAFGKKLADYKDLASLELAFDMIDTATSYQEITVTEANKLLTEAFGKTIKDYKDVASLELAIQMIDYVTFFQEFTGEEANKLLTEAFGKTVKDYTDINKLDTALSILIFIDGSELTIAEVKTMFALHNDTIAKHESSVDSFTVALSRYIFHRNMTKMITNMEYGFDANEVKALVDDLTARVLPSSITTLADATKAVSDFLLNLDDAFAKMSEAAGVLKTEEDYKAAADAVQNLFTTLGFKTKAYIDGTETTIVNIFTKKTGTNAKFEVYNQDGSKLLADTEGTIDKVSKDLGVAPVEPEKPVVVPEKPVAPAPTPKPAPTPAPAPTPVAKPAPTTMTNSNIVPTSDSTNTSIYMISGLVAIALFAQLLRKREEEAK